MTKDSADAESRKGCFENIAFWRSLNRDLPISDQPWPDPPAPYGIPDDEMRAHVETMRVQGYFQTRPIVPAATLERLSRCIRTVVKWRMRSSYVLLYDEFYHLFGSLQHVLTPILGADYRSSSLAAEPRLSVAVYFQSRHIPPVHRTTMEIGTGIPFDHRLYLVEKVWRDPTGEHFPGAITGR